jgi:hypothetical protein
MIRILVPDKSAIVSSKNCRFIKIIQKTPEIEKGRVNIVTTPNSWLHIPTTYSLDIILNMIYSDKQYEVSGVWNGFTPLCRRCKGTGRIDWVSKIVGNMNIPSEEIDYIPDQSTLIIHYNEKFIVTHCNAIPTLSPGEKICKWCFGSGLLMDIEFEIPERSYWLNGNRYRAIPQKRE